MGDLALEFFAWDARTWVCAGSNFAVAAHIALYRGCPIEGDSGQVSCDHVRDDALDARIGVRPQGHPMHQTWAQHPWD